ncbi:MAG: DUF4404 family protein [Gammaproteobacteria bacterium]
MSEQLKAWLEESKATLANLDPSSAEFEHLDGIIKRLEQAFLNEQIESVGDANRFDLDQLKAELVELEVSHPRVTGILNDLLVTLSGMGI